VLHAALRYKRPVYIELPRDVAVAPGIQHHTPLEFHEQSDDRTLREALAEGASDDQRRAKAGHSRRSGSAPVWFAKHAVAAR